WPQTASYHHQAVLTPFNVACTGVFNALALSVIECHIGLNSHGLPLSVQVQYNPVYNQFL
ncbi:hypothetical protein Angca_003891, partial [Angiostrongylus cantonensis]